MQVVSPNKKDLHGVWEATEWFKGAFGTTEKRDVRGSSEPKQLRLYIPIADEDCEEFVKMIDIEWDSEIADEIKRSVDHYIAVKVYKLRKGFLNHIWLGWAEVTWGIKKAFLGYVAGNSQREVWTQIQFLLEEKWELNASEEEAIYSLQFGTRSF